jgi:hypothetical protein
VDEDGFWRLIDDVRAGEKNVTPLVVSRLADRLSRLSGDHIDGFLREFGNAHRGAYRWDLWAAGYLIQDSMGDDGFTDFRTWLIAHGRTAYERALAEPDTLADLTWRDDLEDMGLAEHYGAQVMQAWGGRRSGLMRRTPGSSRRSTRRGSLFPRTTRSGSTARSPVCGRR